MVPSLPLLSCESSVSVKENPDRKKKKTITFDDRDPPSINSHVKHLINEKNIIYKNYLKNSKTNHSFTTFQSFQSQLSLLIPNLKNKYYSKVAKKLLDLSTSPKHISPY